MTDPNRTGVYGENHPPEDDRPEPDIREQIVKEHPEQGVDEALEQVRKDAARPETSSGGMGRAGTPNPDAPQGEFSRDEDGSE